MTDSTSIAPEKVSTTPWLRGLGIGTPGLIAIGLGMLLLGLLVLRALAGPPEFVVDRAGPMADPEWPLIGPDGSEVTLGDFRGQTVFLNMWATWCPPCMAELPSIARLHAAVEGEDIAVVAVAWDDDPSPIPDALASRNAQSLPVYLPRLNPPADMSFTAIPTTFVIAPDGRVVFRHAGAYEWDSAESLAFLREVSALTD